MAESAASETESAGRSLKRYLWIALPLIAVAGVLFVIYKDEIQVRGWINRLSSADARVRLEQREALKAHEDRPLVNRLLAEAVADDSKTFDVRMLCANLLIEGQRLNLLEKAFAEGAVRTRGVVLKAIANEKFFDSFVEEHRGRVEETIVSWIGNAGDATRSHALQLAVKLGMDQVADKVGPILTEPVDPTIHPRDRRTLLIAAAGAAEKFAQCDSMPRILELARTHPDSLVRLRCMQIAERSMYRVNPPPACPDAVPAAGVEAVVTAALSDEERSVRMGALLILARHQEWSAKLEEPLQALLDNKERTPSERRHALEVLATLGRPAFVERFPMYFHAEGFEIRSSAARAIGALESAPLTGCLVGIVDRENEQEQLWRDAMDGLRQAAGTWVGLPADLVKLSLKDQAEFRKVLHTLFVRGEIEGATRQGVVEAWFRWWCGQLKLDEATTEKAVAARAAFWAAAEKGDVAGADAALNAVGTDRPGLFTYERGWLLSRGNAGG